MGSDNEDEAMDVNQEDIEMVDYDVEIKKFKTQIENDPYNVELNEKLMVAYKSNGDFEELAALRKEFSAKSPLSASGWISWIKDSVESGADRSEIENLFELAVFDSNSLKVWLEYVQWSLGLGDFNYTREKMESAVLAVGLRVDCGALIWHSFLDFEELLMANDSDGKQKERVIALYRRALRVPTIDGGIWTRYLEFCENSPDPELKAIYDKCCAHLDKLSPFEMKVAASDDGIEAFAEYLDYEMEQDDPGRIQALFERIVDVHNQDEAAWLRYGMWCESELKVHSVACRVYERAVRQCPFSCSLWQQTLLALERANADPAKIDQLWQIAKETVETASDGRALYRTYIYGLRRRISAVEKKDWSKMTEVFEAGQKVLNEYFASEWDPHAEYRRNYAYFAYSVLGDIEKGRLIWKDILASGGGRLADRWLEAVRLERRFGDYDAARKLFNKALNSVSDHPNLIYEAFIQFEREEGTLADLDKAVEKVNAQVVHRGNRPQKQKEEVAPKAKGRKEEASKGPHARGQPDRKEARKRPAADEPAAGRTAAKKTPATFPTAANTSPGSPAKDKDGFAMPSLPMKKAEKSVSNETASSSAAPVAGGPSGPHGPPTDRDKNLTVFVSNLDFKVTPDKIKEVFDGVVEVRLIYRGASKLHKGYGFVDLESEGHVRAALAKDRVPIDGRPMLVSVNDPEKRTGFKYEAGLEKNKVFVRNVHYDCTEKQLRDTFDQFGKILDVRMVTHKSGKAKGCAYIDFETEESAKKAIAAEITLLERSVSVSLSNPPKRSEGGSVANAVPEGGRKSHLQIVPRAVNRKPAPTANGGAKGVPAGAKNLSNDQFRQFLSLKK